MTAAFPPPSAAAAAVTPQEEGYLTQLDAVRAIAVLGVCIHHWHRDWDWGGLPIDSARVQLFFALSGFLITMILLKARDRCDKAGVGCWQALRAFYVRRILRIWPLFFLFLFASAALNLYPFRETFWWHFTFLTNFKIFSDGQYAGITTHLWSLAVEEQFYLLWPWLILFIPKRALVPSLIVFALIVNTIHTVIVWHVGERWTGVNFLPTACVNTLVYGSILAFYRNHPKLDRWAAILGLWIGIPLIIAVWLLDRGDYLGPFGTSLQRATLAFLLGWLLLKTARGVGGVIGAILNFSPLLWLGKISFGIYILHNTPLTFFREYFQPWPIPSILHTPITKVIFLAIVTIVLSAISYYCFEKPVNALKHHFPYAPRKKRESAEVPVEPDAAPALPEALTAVPAPKSVT